MLVKVSRTETKVQYWVSVLEPKFFFRNQNFQFQIFLMFPTAVLGFTPPIAEILCVKNGRAIVVCGFLMKSSFKDMLKV